MVPCFFSATPIDADLADDLLNDLREETRFDWSRAGPNSSAAFSTSIFRASFDTGVGEDGIPYSGYHPIHKLAGRIFSAVSRKIACDKKVPDKHNYTVLTLQPKKLDAFNEFGAVVPPEKTPPIGKVHLQSLVL